jgi:hypothetical protein
MKLTITKATIAGVTGLPVAREKYFKIVDKKICKKFLNIEHQDPDWAKGIPRSYIKE